MGGEQGPGALMLWRKPAHVNKNAQKDKEWHACARLGTARSLAALQGDRVSTRRLDWRSALGSYAVFQNIPSHTA